MNESSTFKAFSHTQASVYPHTWCPPYFFLPKDMEALSAQRAVVAGALAVFDRARAEERVADATRLFTEHEMDLARIAAAQESARVRARATKEATRAEERVRVAARYEAEREMKIAQRQEQIRDEYRRKVAAADSLREGREKAARRTLELERWSRGGQKLYLLHHRDQVDALWRDDGSVTCVALGSTGGVEAKVCTAMLSEDGSAGWTEEGLPAQLHVRLNGRDPGLPAPAYMSLGTRGRYYIRFADGTSQWNTGGDAAADAFLDRLDRRGGAPTVVAFGAGVGSHFILLGDRCGHRPEGGGSGEAGNRQKGVRWGERERERAIEKYT